MSDKVSDKMNDKVSDKEETILFNYVEKLQGNKEAMRFLFP